MQTVRIDSRGCNEVRVFRQGNLGVHTSVTAVVVVYESVMLTFGIVKQSVASDLDEGVSIEEGVPVVEDLLDCR